MSKVPPTPSRTTTRRRFLQTSALGAGALVSGLALGERAPQPAGGKKGERPNFLILFCDQLGLDALSGHGCPYVHTPNMDRLVERGVTFVESHSTDPVCSPARSSVFTGRMPTETGVISNDRPIHPSVPNMGQWLGPEGYDTVYCGKWHLPHGYPTSMEGFTVLPVGGGQGDIVDTIVSRSCAAYLKSRDDSSPFLLVASIMQPHDICYWAIHHEHLVPENMPFAHLAGELPELPPNHRARPRAPKELDNKAYKGFVSDEQWRYYLYIYYRQVEMADADIGRILDALEDSGQAENTIIVLTSDHGDGRARHQHVQKWYPYDESVKVPMVISCPDRIAGGRRDTEHLVSGVDLMSTVCDYAGVAPPPDVCGRSLRPLLEERPVEWREFVVADTHIIGRMLRTPDYKYVRYQDDPVEQFFDMRADPWETKNLYDDPKFADVIADHRALLDDWEGRLKKVKPTTSKGYRPPGRGKGRKA